MIFYREGFGVGLVFEDVGDLGVNHAGTSTGVKKNGDPVTSDLGLSFDTEGKVGATCVGGGKDILVVGASGFA